MRSGDQFVPGSKGLTAAADVVADLILVTLDKRSIADSLADMVMRY